MNKEEIIDFIVDALEATWDVYEAGDDEELQENQEKMKLIINNLDKLIVLEGELK